MLSIEEAKYAHTHVTYKIPAGVRLEWGSEAIIRELEAEVAAAHQVRIGKLRSAMIVLYQRIVGGVPKTAPKQLTDPVAALRTGD